MAGSNTVANDQTFAAGADLTGKMYFAAKIGAADHTVILATAASDNIGILQGEGTTGRAVTVRMGGTSKAILGGTVARGDRLKSDANGRLVVGTTTDKCMAIALESGANLEEREVLVVPGMFFGIGT